MLQNPMEFNTAVQALLAAQQQSINAGRYGEIIYWGKKPTVYINFPVSASFKSKKYLDFSFFTGSALNESNRNILSKDRNCQDYQ